MATESFSEFCEAQGLRPQTIEVLSKNGFEDESSLALLTKEIIEDEMKEHLVMAQRLRLIQVVEKLHSAGKSVQVLSPNVAISEPARQLITRDYYTFPSEQKGEIRIVLLGKTGAGKSSTANTIFGLNEFLCAAGVSSETKICSGKGVVLDSQPVLVVDTPGVCDTDRPAEDVEDEITRCLALSMPGPHCLIMIIKCDRFTDEELLAYQKMKFMFGENVKKYMILLATRRDQVKKDFFKDIEKGNTAMKSIRSLQTIMDDVEGRCIVFDNNTDPETKDRQVLALMKMVTDLIATRSPRYFQDEASSRVERAIKEQAYKRAHEKQIPFKEANKSILKELNEKKKPGILRELAKMAKIGVLLATAAGLVVATGGLGSLAVAGVAGEIGAGAALASAAGATASCAGAIGATKMAVDTHQGHDNSACSLM